MTPERRAKFIAALNRRQPDLTIIADQINKPQNLSALIRTCDAVGIHRAHAVVPSIGYRDFNGTARGSGQWVDVASHATTRDALRTVREAGMKVYAAHWSERAKDYREVDYTQPVAILLGAEMRGVSAEGAEQADEHILVPMMGMVASLNVSVAAGIILHEALHQRERAGLYDQPRLSEQEYADTFFRWAHANVAEYCHKHGLAYPPLDAEGELADPVGWYRAAREGVAPKRQFE